MSNLSTDRSERPSVGRGWPPKAKLRLEERPAIFGLAKVPPRGSVRMGSRSGATAISPSPTAKSIVEVCRAIVVNRGNAYSLSAPNRYPIRERLAMLATNRPSRGIAVRPSESLPVNSRAMPTSVHEVDPGGPILPGASVPTAPCGQARKRSLCGESPLRRLVLSNSQLSGLKKSSDKSSPGSP